MPGLSSILVCCNLTEATIFVDWVTLAATKPIVIYCILSLRFVHDSCSDMSSKRHDLI